MKVNPKAKWKSIPMSHNFFTGDMDQAVCGGIEELTDYTLVVKGKKSGKVLKRELSAAKSSHFKVDGAKSSYVEKDDTEAPLKKKAKKNVFQVTDVESLVGDDIQSDESKKLKKKNKKLAKPAINLSVFNNLAEKVVEKENNSIESIEETKSGKEDSVEPIIEAGIKPDEANKLKKKNKKAAKPAINLSVFNKLAEKVVENEKKTAPVIEKVDPSVNEKENIPIKPVVEKENIANKPAKKEKKEKKESVPNKPVKKKGKKGKERVVAELDPSAAIDIAEMGEWKDLFVCDEIIKALAENGFKSPTPIQKLTLPASINGNMDIVGAAETGSGKTLAFGIPIIQGILEDRRYEETHKEEFVDEEEGGEEVEVDENDINGFEASKSRAVNVVDDVEMDFDIVEEEMPAVSTKGDKLRALILTPTRELAMQVHKHMVAAAKHTGVRVAVVVGGLSVEKQIRLLSRGPAVVVATPGRLWDLVQEGNTHLMGLSKIRYLAIDETDRMVEKGHFEELQKILEMVNNTPNSTDSRRQTFIMSATLSLTHKPPQHAKKQKQMSKEEKLGELMEAVGVKERRKVVDITRKAGTAETLSESVIHCALTDKDFFLYYFVKIHSGRTVVFCNSIDCVRRLTNLFSLLDVTPLPLHAQLHQKQRLKNLDRFTNSNTGFLIATDVAARGLDIPHIEHVVHYQVPRTSETYIHRSGRTARAARQGLSLLLVEPGEQNMLRKLCQTLAKDGDHTLPVFPVDQSRMGVVRDRMGLARKLDKLLLATRKKTVGENWRTKAAEDADLILSDEEDSEEEFYQGRLEGNSKTSVEFVKKELQQMLKTPLSHQVYGGAYPTMGGGMPTDVLARKEEKAVDALQNNLKYTQNLLRSKKRPEKPQNKFKGFKKRKQKGQET